jgi:hypothetical protein
MTKRGDESSRHINQSEAYALEIPGDMNLSGWDVLLEAAAGEARQQMTTSIGTRAVVLLGKRIAHSNGNRNCPRSPNRGNR